MPVDECTQGVNILQEQDVIILHAQCIPHLLSQRLDCVPQGWMGHVDGQPHPVPVTPLLAAAVDLVLSFEQCLGRAWLATRTYLSGVPYESCAKQQQQQQQPA
jgi:hypothetical protein